MIMRTTFANFQVRGFFRTPSFLSFGFVVMTASVPYVVAQSATAVPSEATGGVSVQAGQTAAAVKSDAPKEVTPAKPDVLVIAPKARKGEKVYTGPTDILTLPPTPMLDGEGKQRIDPDGNPMFSAARRQIRDKKGHPVYAAGGAPVFQTATDLGYDEKGKKIVTKKVKAPKMLPISISAGTLTIDGWTGKARLNYDIADVKYLYIYAPGIGTMIVSPSSFPGAKEQPEAFNDQVLKIMVDGHPIELSSEKQLLGKKPLSAWVMVDRGFLLPTKFPVFGYGSTSTAPYVWPGAKDTVARYGTIQAPPLPKDVRPALLVAPCPAGMMRAMTVPRGQNVAVEQCFPIDPHVTPDPAKTTSAAASLSPGAE